MTTVESRLAESRKVATFRLPRFKIRTIIPLLLILVVACAGTFGPWLAPLDPYQTSLREAFKPPVWEASGSWQHIFGTDSLGRDILTRMVYGSRITLLVCVVAIGLGALVGAAIGLMTGYYGGVIDTVFMRIADAAIAFPIIFIGMLLSVTIQPSFWTVVAAIALTLWARFAIVIRGEVLTLKERDFIALARMSGCSSWRVLYRHLFPNVTNSLLVLVSLNVGLVIVTEASLSFLGAGVPPPAPTWGAMVAEGRNYLNNAWWVSSIPGLAILVTSVAFNLAGDWLRDTLDPRLRQV